VSTWRRNFIVLFVTNFLTAMGLMAMLPFFPVFLRDMGLANEGEIAVWSGVIVGAAPLMAALMSGFWGAIGDHVGRRAMVLRALAGITVFVGLMAFARSPLHLLLLRIGQGTFSGFLAPTVTLVSVTAPLDRQGRVGGMLQTAMLLGAAVGPVYGAATGVRFGLIGTACSCAALSLVALTLVRLLVTEPPQAIAPPDEHRATSKSVFHRAIDDLVDALRQPALRSLMISLFLVRLATSAVNPTLIVYVEQLTGGASEVATRVGGYVFSAYPVAVVLTVAIWSHFADRRGARGVIAVCIVAAGLATTAQAFVTTALQLGVFRFVCGVFSAGILPAAFAFVATSSSVHKRGGTLGLAFSALTLGLALGPALGGVVTATLGVPALFLACGTLLLLALLPLCFSHPESVAARRSGG